MRPATYRSILVALSLFVAACAEAPPPIQTIRDHHFYGGLAAFVEGHYDEARAAWERAAHFGDPEAARNLGHLYRQGLGGEADAAIALAWYQVAADAGVATAQYNLGMLYMKGGPHLEPDRAQGLVWLTKAAEAGVPHARKELERLAAAVEPPPAPPPSPSVTEPPPPVSPPALVKVQIGSYRTQAAAEQDWQRFARSGLAHEVVKARMGDRGLWYRLLVVGPSEGVEDFCAHREICWPGKARIK
ncbi:TPR repeat SEL1 subfamily [Candidatus Terasakiella magnetica]|nr:TPR repeat SEL1 subfamily [Candidatus Terasakiella magnetica]